MLVFLSQLAVEVGIDLGFRVAERPRCPSCEARLPVRRPPRTWRPLGRGGRDCPAGGAFYRMAGGTPVSFDDPPATSQTADRPG